MRTEWIHSDEQTNILKFYLILIIIIYLLVHYSIY